MNNRTINIFNSSSCVTTQTLIDYTNAKLLKAETLEVEKHLADCEMCRDAHEGLLMMKNKDELPVYTFQINTAINFRTKGSEKRLFFNNKWLSIAAVFLILIGIASILNYSVSLTGNGQMAYETIKTEQVAEESSLETHETEALIVEDLSEEPEFVEKANKANDNELNIVDDILELEADFEIEEEFADEEIMETIDTIEIVDDDIILNDTVTVLPSVNLEADVNQESQFKKTENTKIDEVLNFNESSDDFKQARTTRNAISDNNSWLNRSRKVKSVIDSDELVYYDKLLEQKKYDEILDQTDFSKDTNAVNSYYRLMVLFELKQYEAYIEYAKKVEKNTDFEAYYEIRWKLALSYEKMNKLSSANFIYKKLAVTENAYQQAAIEKLSQK